MKNKKIMSNNELTEQTSNILTLSGTSAYTATFQWRTQTSMTIPSGKMFYKINSGAWTLLMTTTTSTNYLTVGSITGLTSGYTVSIAIQNTSSVNAKFSEGLNGAFTGTYCGESTPYSFVVMGDVTKYFNISTTKSGSNTIMLTC